MQLKVLLLLPAVLHINKACDCGQSQNNRVIGGSEVNDGDYPWMASIISASDYTFSRCGATIITEQYALTAYHCTKGNKPFNDRLLVGGFNLDNPDSGSQYLEISEYIRYDPGRHHDDDDDIAIIVLTKRLDFTRTIQPICLPPAGQDYAGVSATVLGYGDTDSNSDSASDVPLSAEISVTSNANCNEVLDQFGGDSVSQAQLCAGSYHSSKDACSGDSGGPLMYFDPSYSRWALIGIVAAGYGCDERSSYGFYTNVSHFADWIQKNIGNSGCQL